METIPACACYLVQQYHDRLYPTVLKRKPGKYIYQNNGRRKKAKRIEQTGERMNLLPTPEAARYNKAGAPKPPAPTTKMEDLTRFDCPVNCRIFSEYF